MISEFIVLFPVKNINSNTGYTHSSSTYGKGGKRIASLALALAIVALLIISISTAYAGMDVWTSHGPYGGPVSSVVVDPSNPSTLFVGTLFGGVFKSTDGGATWASSNSGLSFTWVKVMVSPGNSIVYAGVWYQGGSLQACPIITSGTSRLTL